MKFSGFIIGFNAFSTKDTHLFFSFSNTFSRSHLSLTILIIKSYRSISITFKSELFFSIFFNNVFI
ncbi:hypothetical protein HOG21_04815 [bacterium]|nr:hypothetical protein [bacterium]